MIVVHTTIPVDPDRRDEAREVVSALAERSRQEDGTIRYRAMIDIEDSSNVRFFEQYEDESAWTAHVESEHYMEFMSRLPDLVDGQMETVTIVDCEAHVHRFTADDLEQISS